LLIVGLPGTGTVFLLGLPNMADPQVGVERALQIGSGPLDECCEIVTVKDILKPELPISCVNGCVIVPVLPAVLRPVKSNQQYPYESAFVVPPVEHVFVIIDGSAA
jgi:hypothetical protein